MDSPVVQPSEKEQMLQLLDVNKKIFVDLSKVLSQLRQDIEAANKEKSKLTLELVEARKESQILEQAVLQASKLKTQFSEGFKNKISGANNLDLSWLYLDIDAGQDNTQKMFNGHRQETRNLPSSFAVIHEDADSEQGDEQV